MSTGEQIWNKHLVGWAWQIKSEFVQLLDLMIQRNVKSVLETGTNKGGTSYGFLQLGCEVISIDLNKHAPVERLEKEFPETFKFIQENSSKVFTFSGFDMLFIDGDHSYDGVKADYDNFIHNVNENGIIVFHDIKESELHKKQSCLVSKFWKEIRGERFIEFCDHREEWGGIGVKFL